MIYKYNHNISMLELGKNMIKEKNIKFKNKLV